MSKKGLLLLTRKPGGLNVDFNFSKSYPMSLSHLVEVRTKRWSGELLTSNPQEMKGTD